MIHETQGGYVKSERQNGITTIEFHHPKSNSLPGKVLSELATAVHEAGNDEETKLIILRSHGEKAFCAGASFDELVSIQTLKDGITFFSGFANVINAMRKCPKFIIGRIHGKCVGGGVGCISFLACVYSDSYVSLCGREGVSARPPNTRRERTSQRRLSQHQQTHTNTHTHIRVARDSREICS